MPAVVSALKTRFASPAWYPTLPRCVKPSRRTLLQLDEDHGRNRKEHAGDVDLVFLVWGVVAWRFATLRGLYGHESRIPHSADCAG